MTLDQARSLAERDAKFQVAGHSNGLGWPAAEDYLIVEVVTSGLMREYTAAVCGAIAQHDRMREDRLFRSLTAATVLVRSIAGDLVDDLVAFAQAIEGDVRANTLPATEVLALPAPEPTARPSRRRKV